MLFLKQYQDYIARREEILHEHPVSERVWLHQTRRYVEPFQIYGNLYYVGDDWVCVHLIDTGEGLLLFDAGNCGGDAKAMLIHSIWKLGFNPENIKWIILSHAHVDHIGAAAFLQEMFGSKLYISEHDAQMMKEKPEFTYIQQSTDVADRLFSPDVIIRDGETHQFGNTSVRFITVPGHTPGTLACFFNVTNGKETKQAGYFGGYGFNTMTRAELEEYGDVELKRRQQFQQSIDKVIEEPVELFIANHTENGDIGVLEKLARQKEHPETNSFLNDGEWKRYLSLKRQQMENFMNEMT